MKLTKNQKQLLLGLLEKEISYSGECVEVVRNYIKLYDKIKKSIEQEK